MISDKLIDAIRENCEPKDFDIDNKDDKWLLVFLDWEDSFWEQATGRRTPLPKKTIIISNPK